MFLHSQKLFPFVSSYFCSHKNEKEIKANVSEKKLIKANDKLNKGGEKM